MRKLSAEMIIIRDYRKNNTYLNKFDLYNKKYRFYFDEEIAQTFCPQQNFSTEHLYIAVQNICFNSFKIIPSLLN